MSLTQRKIFLSLGIIALVGTTTLVFHLTQGFYKRLMQGRNAFESGRYDQALQSFINAHRSKPDNRQAIKYLLWTYDKLDMKKEAKSLVEELIGDGYKNPLIITRLADSYYKENNYQKAEELYRQSLANEDSLLVKRRLSQVLAWQKKYEEATAVLNEILKKDSKDIESKVLLADLYMWRKVYAEAIKLYRDVLVSKPSDEVRLKLADSLRFSGNNEEAITFYNQILNED